MTKKTQEIQQKIDNIEEKEKNIHSQILGKTGETLDNLTRKFEYLGGPAAGAGIGGAAGASVGSAAGLAKAIHNHLKKAELTQEASIQLEEPTASSAIPLVSPETTQNSIHLNLNNLEKDIRNITINAKQEPHHFVDTSSIEVPSSSSTSVSSASQGTHSSMPSLEDVPEQQLSTLIKNTQDNGKDLLKLAQLTLQKSKNPQATVNFSGYLNDGGYHIQTIIRPTGADKIRKAQALQNLINQPGEEDVLFNRLGTLRQARRGKSTVSLRPHSTDDAAKIVTQSSSLSTKDPVAPPRGSRARSNAVRRSETDVRYPPNIPQSSTTSETAEELVDHTIRPITPEIAEEVSPLSNVSQTIENVAASGAKSGLRSSVETFGIGLATGTVTGMVIGGVLGSGASIITYLRDKDKKEQSDKLKKEKEIYQQSLENERKLEEYLRQHPDELSDPDNYGNYQKFKTQIEKEAANKDNELVYNRHHDYLTNKKSLKAILDNPNHVQETEKILKRLHPEEPVALSYMYQNSEREQQGLPPYVGLEKDTAGNILNKLNKTKKAKI